MLPRQTYVMKLNGHSMVYNAKPFENVGKFEVEAEFTPFVGATEEDQRRCAHRHRGC